MGKMKFQNPFKVQPPKPQAEKQPEVETVVLLAMLEKGGGTIPHLNIDGIKKQRPATMKDLERMCAEVLISAVKIEVSDRVVNSIAAMFGPPPQQPPAPKQPEQPENDKPEKEQAKEEAKVGEGSNSDNTEAPAESERPA